eukprot:2295701-Amphidinium_carterae.1
MEWMAVPPTEPPVKQRIELVRGLCQLGMKRGKAWQPQRKLPSRAFEKLSTHSHLFIEAKHVNDLEFTAQFRERVGATLASSMPCRAVGIDPPLLSCGVQVG